MVACMPCIRHGKVAGLLDQGRDLDGLLEIEMPDGIHIAHQAAQGLRNRACQHPGQGDRQHDDQQGGQGRPFQLAPGVSGQLGIGNGHEQAQVLRLLHEYAHGRRAPHGAAAIDIPAQRPFLAAQRLLEKLCQGGTAQFGQLRHGATALTGMQQRGNALMGHQFAFAIDQGQFGTGRDFVARQECAQRSQVDIGTHHGAPFLRRSRERDAHRARV